MDKKPAISIICILAVAAVVFGALYFSNSSQNEKLKASLREETISLHQEADQLRTEVVARTEEAEALREQLAASAAQIEEANARIAEQEAANAEKEAQIAEMTEEINYRAAQITEMKAEIDRLTAIVQDYENWDWYHPDWEDPNYQKMKEMETVIAELQYQLENQLTSIEAQEEEIARLKTRIAELEGTAEPDPSLPAQP